MTRSLRLAPAPYQVVEIDRRVRPVMFLRLDPRERHQVADKVLEPLRLTVNRIEKLARRRFVDVLRMFAERFDVADDGG